MGLLFAAAQPVLLPVTVDIGGGIRLTTVNLGAAIVVLLAFLALGRAAAAVWSTPVIRWIEWSQVSAVTVFLVAQLNGVQDIAALVGLYALTAGSSLFLVSYQSQHANPWIFSFGAAVAIVPWGIVAFYQVGSIVIGDDPSVIVRIITIVTLLVAALYWWACFDVRRAHQAHVVLAVAGTSAFAWLSLLAGGA